MRRIAPLLLLVFSACTSSVQNETESSTYTVNHASTFHFERINSKEYLVVDEPWPKSTVAKKYELSKPLKRVVCTSTSHLPYFEMLGLEDAVVGFPNMNYVSSENFNKRAEEGKIIDLGVDGSLNMEILIGLQPDAVIAFDAGGESTSLEKIQNLGIPVIYNSDFLEQSPLGRAEWIKVFGALFHQREKADSIFNSIESEYNRVKELAKNVEERPTIISGVVYGDTWFLPGGANWAATFYENAGGDYIWKSDTTSGWLELGFEAVYEVGFEAEFWIGVSTFESTAAMIGQEDRYQEFSALQEGQVYNYNKKKGPNGGIDFFESGYSRPDLVLSDLIKILHPTLLPNYETVYFHQLK
ncbi:MAG: ABC transporter substrate-binding protein [Ekhidna sp.]|nr:ABC transporter substrate-binding protein [Ekhidna sp.]